MDPVSMLIHGSYKHTSRTAADIKILLSQTNFGGSFNIYIYFFKSHANILRCCCQSCKC